MAVDISVIVCTHNPRRDYFRRVLDALRTQTLPKEQWELLLIDNASKEPLAGHWDLSWHPHARHIREDELGLTPVRLRGIREATAEVLVFVDDDNVLSADYLSSALKLTLSHGWVGAFGGNIVGEFEAEPESWAEKVLPFLGIISVQHEEWTLNSGTKALSSVPRGAGMVIRRKIATYYGEMSANDPLRHGLDRKGDSLASAGDSDLALCACVLGFAVGRFPQLQMTHLISARRLKQDYLLRLAEEMASSLAVLRFIWDGHLPGKDIPCRSEKIFRAYKSFRNRLRKRNQPDFMYEFSKAWDRGILRAVPIIRSQQNGTGGESFRTPNS